MIENGIQVSIVISDPWDAYKVFNGVIIRSLNSDQYVVIKENESDQLYLVQSCHFGEHLIDVLKGTNICIGISIILPELDLLTIPEITHNEFKLLNYIGIGGMELKVDV
jgi:hypothetical protein